MACATMSCLPKTYDAAVNALRGREQRKIGNNTYLVADGDNVAIRHHWTNIITFHPDNTVTVKSGGWRSPSTRDRLRLFGIHILQSKRKWYLDGKPFEDGMKVAAPLDIPEWRRIKSR